MTIDKLIFYTFLSMVDDPTPADLYRQALEAALSCNWEKALEINLKISELQPNSIECLNRTAKAYLELGEYSKAKKIYQQVLELDPYNTIAQKNLKRVSSFNSITAGNGELKSNGNGGMISPSLFLEEPGITKTVNLVKVAEPQKLLKLSFGTKINLIPKKRGVTIYDQGGNYLGALPDDFAHHLQKLIKGGNKYEAIIKSIKPNGLTILVREIFRSKKFKNQASFLDESKILAYSSDNISLGSEQQEGEIATDSEDSPII